MSSKAIVIDANILIRAVFGRRVLELIVEYAADVDVVAPDVAYADARKYLPQLLKKRGLSADAAMTMLDRLETVVNVMGCEDYVAMKERALQRIAVRDADDSRSGLRTGSWLSSMDRRCGLFWNGRGNMDNRSGRAIFQIRWMFGPPFATARAGYAKRIRSVKRRSP